MSAVNKYDQCGSSKCQPQANRKTHLGESHRPVTRPCSNQNERIAKDATYATIPTKISRPPWEFLPNLSMQVPDTKQADAPQDKINAEMSTGSFISFFSEIDFSERVIGVLVVVEQEIYGIVTHYIIVDADIFFVVKVIFDKKIDVLGR